MVKREFLTRNNRVVTREICLTDDKYLRRRPEIGDGSRESARGRKKRAEERDIKAKKPIRREYQKAKVEKSN
ncbi:hypothetical protein GWI33_023176 [Rhynchophorus ferrugineus]|uniref:Uncharacterized protein n=1 Tax=Rhynchophorus ferrugineus TaxID=354439 RepID=A0A834HTA0_RHYFE|nr:hypothetical protein GWI33_000384 [Rhynchophorus ferrugineus]KAF7264458.1 hypothetical protein GWI33_023176 [Rhynchophorus ferrugineus]